MGGTQESLATLENAGLCPVPQFTYMCNGENMARFSQELSVQQLPLLYPRQGGPCAGEGVAQGAGCTSFKATFTANSLKCHRVRPQICIWLLPPSSLPPIASWGGSIQAGGPGQPQGMDPGVGAERGGGDTCDLGQL
ncbi:inner centromere protein-like [Platysternon megacephalum]|uniref:Inner centromere protein-like n=1 Tax=Platysternon megacephalum TaxID=55544 RepID=A0A4D9E4W7_9SAUR|nr:inner centromere protein-like [Platysternon megacephalum]